MKYTTILTQVFETIIFPLLTIGTLYLISFVKIKIKNLKQQENNELYNKYLSMLEETIVNCVLATTQTYVDGLKKQGKFDKEAQIKAFNMTYENVMSILTTDAKRFLENAIGDLGAFVNNRIEAEVLANK